MLSHADTTRKEPKPRLRQVNAGVPGGHEEVLQHTSRPEAWDANWRAASRAGATTGRPAPVVGDRLVGAAPSRIVQWIRFWVRSHEYRRRRAYFRPRDPSSVDVSLVTLIDRMVMVRLTVVSACDRRGERLYRCSFHSPRRTILRPASDFDFLD